MQSLERGVDEARLVFLGIIFPSRFRASFEKVPLARAWSCAHLFCPLQTSRSECLTRIGVVVILLGHFGHGLVR